jgi:hypothetical protein
MKKNEKKELAKPEYEQDIFLKKIQWKKRA